MNSDRLLSIRHQFMQTAGTSPKIKTVPFCIFILLCSLVTRSETIVGLKYVLITGAITFGFFFLFTKSIEERFLWSVGSTPISMFSTPFLDIFLNPADIIGVFVLLEFVLTRKHLSKKVPPDVILAGLLLISIFISYLFTPYSNLAIGPVLRASSRIALFYIGTVLLDSWGQLISLIKVIALMFAAWLLSINLSAFDIFEARDLIQGEKLAYPQYHILYASLSFPCVLFFRKMRNYFVYTTMAMVSLILLIICQSQYGFLIAFSYVLIVFVAKRLSFGKLVYLSIAIIVVTFGVMHFYESRGLYYIHLGNVGRIEKFVDALVTFTQYPITGIGFGGLIRRHELGIGQLHLTLLEDGFKLISGTPENAFLGILGETGLLGAIPFYLLIGYYLKVVFRSRPKVAVVGFGDYGSVALILKLLLVSLLWSLIAGDNQFGYFTWSLFNLFSLYNKIKKKK